MLFMGGGTNGVTDTAYNLDSAPVRSVEVATNPGGWTEARWTAINPPTNGYRFMIGYEFVENDDVYIIASSVAARPVVNATVKVALAELDTTSPPTGFGPLGRGSFYRIGSGAIFGAFDTSNTYATDVIMEVTTANVPPTANAGVDQTVVEDTLVTLNGSGSTDSDGTIVTYTWTQVSGTAVALSGAGTNRTFTPANPGTYVFGLTCTDEDGGVSAQDLVTITVTSAITGPTVNAGLDRTVVLGSNMALTASVTIPGGRTINTVLSQWSQVSGTAATITKIGQYGMSSILPAIGTYVFRYTAVDSAGFSATDDIIVTIIAGGGGGGNTVFAENEIITGRTLRESWFDGVTTEEMPAFARSSYYLPGQTVQLCIDFNADFNVEIFRLGYYGGTGARRVMSDLPGTPVVQPAAVAIADSNGAVTCDAWTTNFTWSIPLDATPGWYYVLLKGTDGTSFGNVLFCVSDKNAKKSAVIVASESTWMGAYNGYGSKNLYGAAKGIGVSTDRSLCVSYDRPVITQDYVPQTHFFNGEYATLRFFERAGYDVGYTTNEQITRDPSILDGRSVIIFSGHNEYTSSAVLEKTKQLVNAGTHVVNMAANDFFWRVRFGTIDDAAITTLGRVMWGRKDTMPGPDAHVAGVPFVDNADWQGTWQDTRWPLRQPSESLFADRFVANGIRADKITVPAAMKSLPIWRNSIVADGLSSAFEFGDGSAGMEWDTPSGPIARVKLSSVSVDLENNASDLNGQNYNEDGVFEHCITLSRLNTTSGLIFNFNTTQWGWALDAFHLRGTNIANAGAIQATLNILADLGFMPSTVAVSRIIGMTYPTPVGDVGLAYGLESSTPPPPNPNPDPTGSASQVFYSDGVEWHPL
jgi:hypothetical protein